MTAQQHTLSLPLRIARQENNSDSSIVDIVEANGRLVCPIDEYDAPEIVHSVNAFPALLKACKDYLNATGLHETHIAMLALHDAIELAEKGQL